MAHPRAALRSKAASSPPWTPAVAGHSTGSRLTARGAGVLVARLVDEEIDALASPSMRRSIPATALANAGHVAMPVDPDVLSVFVRKSLRDAMKTTLGSAAADEVCTRLCAMLPVPDSRDASTMPPPPSAQDDGGDEIALALPRERDTVRLAARTEIVWIVAAELGRARGLANALGELGVSARTSLSVPSLQGGRSAVILDLCGADEASVDAWLRQAQEGAALVVTWGDATVRSASNVRACEASLSECEVALYCASLLV